MLICCFLSVNKQYFIVHCIHCTNKELFNFFSLILDIWKTIKSIPCPVFQNQTFLPLLKFCRCKYHEAIIFHLNLKVVQNARPFFEFPAAVFFYSISLSLSLSLSALWETYINSGDIVAWRKKFSCPFFHRSQEIVHKPFEKITSLQRL